MPKERPLLKIKIDVPGLKPGRIPVPLLLKICQAAQKAVNKQSRPFEEDPQSQLILELVGLKKGSTILELEDSPNPQTEFPFMAEAASYTKQAVSEIADTLATAHNRRGRLNGQTPYVVLDALENLGSVFSEGVRSLKWIVPHKEGGRSTIAIFDSDSLAKIKARKQELSMERRVAALKETADVSPAPLEGMLDLAEGRGSIQPQIGDPITFIFGQEQVERVLEGLHRPVRAIVDQKSRKLVDISLKEDIEMDEPLFFHAKSVDELIAEQGIKAITTFDDLGGSIPEEDLDEFLAEILSARMVQAD